MRISVNLATRPFVELRPFFARLRILMGVLAVAAIALIIVSHSMQKKLNRAQAQMDRLKGQTATAQQEKLHNEQRMRQPTNAAVLARSHFLNALFLTKSFSWTAVMMDLENVLPVGVQVTSIEPQITAEGDVIIHLRVSGDRDRAVQLVRNLERSKRFLVPHINSESSQAKEANGASLPPGATPAVEFEILANYNPLPVGAAFEKVKSPDTASKAASNAASKTKSPAGPSHHPATKPGPHDGIILKPFAPPTRPAPAQPTPARPVPHGGAQ
jgi:type IV pilus assembly protein PilN